MDATAGFYQGRLQVLIRLNSDLPSVRRRFTLAHELGHLLLGIPTVVGESVSESLRSDSAEERTVNDLASELLLPGKIVRRELPSVPIVAAELKRLAKHANVSVLASAIRVANLASAIGLVNASVIFFRGDKFEWQWSQTLEMPDGLATHLLKEARKCHPTPLAFRVRRPTT